MHIRKMAVCAAAALVMLACTSRAPGATGAGASATSASSRTEPPRLMRGSAPELRMPSGSAAGNEPIRIDYEVLVNATGQPDLRTLKVSGRGAAENREAIARWIRAAVFQPARRDGEPVAATFKGSLRVRAAVRQM